MNEWAERGLYKNNDEDNKKSCEHRKANDMRNPPNKKHKRMNERTEEADPIKTHEIKIKWHKLLNVFFFFIQTT